MGCCVDQAISILNYYTHKYNQMEYVLAVTINACFVFHKILAQNEDHQLVLVRDLQIKTAPFLKKVKVVAKNRCFLESTMTTFSNKNRSRY